MMDRNAYEKQVRRRIAANGYTMIGVFDPDGVDPSFVYTVGLHALGHPELVMIGSMQMGVMEAIVAAVAARWLAAGKTELGDLDGIMAGGYMARVGLVDSRHALTKYARQHPVFYPGAMPQFAQLMWPDLDGKFPNQSGYDDHLTQPVLPLPATLH